MDCKIRGIIREAVANQLLIGYEEVAFTFTSDGKETK